MTTTIVTKRFDRIDRICYAFYGSVAHRQVEQVIEANPGLENQPILLPEGLDIVMPDLATDTSTPIIKQITLWS